ncbi:UNVERIFIED_CONTAM: hypothetical protein Sradi_3169900 [Sesamum radiatum]|uniref:Uncharacterized protein n=1 Tax=Sesamum radiatum TaxID=300843 RepID=A0AAW2RF77_SESRA
MGLNGPSELYGAKCYNVIILMVMWYSGIRYETPLGATSKVHMRVQSDQWAWGWTVRGAHWDSIGLPVEASSFSFHLGVLSPADWRLSACDWRCHVPRHGKFYAVVGSLPTWKIR